MLKETVYKLAEEKYGQSLDPYITDRLDKELQMTELLGVQDQIIALYELACVFKKNDTPYCLRGSASSSFVFYLLELSAPNPLPAHYFCPECKNFILSNAVRDGYDLPEKSCACGCLLQHDGHDLYHELFLGVDTAADNESGPVTELEIAQNHQNEVVEFFQNHSGTKHLSPAKRAKGIVTHVGFIGILPSPCLPGCYKGYFAPIHPSKFKQFAFKEYKWQQFWQRKECSTDIKKAVANKRPAITCFNDFTQLLGFLQASFRSNEAFVRQMAEGFSQDKAVVFREDIFSRLIKAGFSVHDALVQTKRVQMGRGLDAEAQYKLGDERFARDCNSIMYMFPKSHCLELLFRDFRLIRRNKNQQAGR